METIKEYIFKKLFFLKLLDVDKPGVIYGKTNHFYSNLRINKRMVFCFEDFLSDLQKYTSSVIGMEKSSSLWYELGRDFGIKQINYAHIKNLDEKNKVEAVKYFFKIFNGSGATCLDRVKYLPYSKIFQTFGKSNIICRKSGDPSFFEGITSGILSSIFGIEYETKYSCDLCSKKCSSISVPTENKFFSTVEPIILSRYKEFNYFQKIPNLKDFVKFKKIKVSSKGEWHFNKKRILPFPHYFFDLLFDHYASNGLQDVLEAGLVKAAQDFLKQFKKSNSYLSFDLKFIENILELFGWGVFTHKQNEEFITFDIFNPATNKDGIRFIIYLLKGYLNFISKGEYELTKIVDRKDLFRLVISFSKK